MSDQLWHLSWRFLWSLGFSPWAPGQWIRYRSMYSTPRACIDRRHASWHFPLPWSFGAYTANISHVEAVSLSNTQSIQSGTLKVA